MIARSHGPSKFYCGYALPFGFRGNGDIQVMRTRGRSYGEWKAVESLAFLDASTDFDDAPVQNLPSTDNDKKWQTDMKKKKGGVSREWNGFIDFKQVQHIYM
nr:hypothetical protein Iba_chr11dCG9460 [Ipomoea batatas]